MIFVWIERTIIVSQKKKKKRKKEQLSIMGWLYVARHIHIHDNSYMIVANIEFMVPVNIGFGGP